MHSPRDPDFVIVGAMKCGTTSVFHWLRQHPEVYAADKELHYFDLHYDNGREWYRHHFREATDKQICGEGTPSYLYLPWARAGLARDLPEARFLVTLRDPVDRAWSHYLHNRERGMETLGFDAALAAEPDRLRDPSEWARCSYASRGRYAEQLEDLFRLVGRERVLTLIFESDVVREPGDTFQRVARFLGIDDSCVPDAVNQRHNSSGRVRSRKVRDACAPLPRALRNAIGHINVSLAREHRIPQETREWLSMRFREDNQRLEQLLGRQLPHWAAASA